MWAAGTLKATWAFLRLVAKEHAAAPVAAALKELMKPLGPVRAKGIFSRSR